MTNSPPPKNHDSSPEGAALSGPDVSVPVPSKVRKVAIATAVTAGLALGASPLITAPTASAARMRASGSAVAHASVLAAADDGSRPMAQADKGGGGLDVAPNWNAPGIKQGKELIGWAKAGAIIFGVLGLMGGVVIGKVLKDAGNHHASGVRSTAIGIGGALVLAGSAPEIVPWLMG
jgi:hypothetical protein